MFWTRRRSRPRHVRVGVWCAVEVVTQPGNSIGKAALARPSCTDVTALTTGAILELHLATSAATGQVQSSSKTKGKPQFE